MGANLAISISTSSAFQDVYGNSRSHWKYVTWEQPSPLPCLTLPSAVSKLEEFDNSVSGGSGTSLTISDAKDILGDCHEGDSIAINGIYRSSSS